MTFRGKRVFRNGKWEDGKAAPEQLREDLRQLPSEIVTKEIEDNDKIHELDPEHTTREVIRKYAAQQAGVPAEPEEPRETRLQDVLEMPNYRHRPPIVQRLVDIERMRTIRSLIDQAIRLCQTGHDRDLEEFVTRPRHLWFPENTVSIVELREGSWGPRDSLRPKRLQGIRLEVDLMRWPESVLDAVREAGFNWQQPEDMLREIKATAAAMAQAEVDMDAMEARGE